MREYQSIPNESQTQTNIKQRHIFIMNQILMCNSIRPHLTKSRKNKSNMRLYTYLCVFIHE